MKLHRENERWMFRCPGCRFAHVVDKRWTFNGDETNPTFTPSLLHRYTTGEDEREVVCHSFVKDGYITYLNDSTHALAGQTMLLPEW